ncbi:MAG: methyltransferase domain-containing protein [Chloroflexi bacterium]|nr:methyltransferase domain-containing protein [Chloroflexota bacterium]
MILRRAWRAFIRFAFHLFYNQFAFTYDLVSAFVSRGHWRAWTRAAIPRLAGTRVLELPCGTGNLTLDLIASGYAPIGVDLSPAMLRITRGKLNREHPERSEAESKDASRLLRARAEALPFASRAFDSIVMPFPPGFAPDPRALAEMNRVLDDRGRLIWVDGGRLLKRDAWDRALDTALDVVSGASSLVLAEKLLADAGFSVGVENVQDDASVVMVITATKG